MIVAHSNPSGADRVIPSRRLLTQVEGMALDDATAIDQARIECQIRELALEHAAGHLENAAYFERLRELREAKDSGRADLG
jgi:hypothetical protein